MSDNDPFEMYLLSIRTRRRLPDQLHGAMLLWSYDERYGGIVKDYLEWAEHCRERDRMENSLRKRIRDIERNERLLSVAATVTMFLFAVVAVALKK